MSKPWLLACLVSTFSDGLSWGETHDNNDGIIRLSSPDKVFVAQYGPGNSFRIINTSKLTVRDIPIDSKPEQMMWTSDSSWLLFGEHIAHGSQLRIFGVTQKGKYAEDVGPPGFDANKDTVYSVVGLDAVGPLVSATYKMSDRASAAGSIAFYLCSFDYNPNTREFSKVVRKEITDDEYSRQGSRK